MAGDAAGHRRRRGGLSGGGQAPDGAFRLFHQLTDTTVIDDGSELCGTSTPVGSSRAVNGFEALRVFDSNGDGVVDQRDQRFNELLVWRDENRNGISEVGELSRLADVGITDISLTYTFSRHRDRWGNVFHYRAEAKATTAPLTRQVYDVYPKMIPLQ